MAVLIEKKSGKNRVLIMGRGFLAAALKAKFSSLGMEVVWSREFREESFDYVIYVFKQGEGKDFFKEQEKSSFWGPGQGGLRTKFLFLSPIFNYGLEVLENWEDFWRTKKLDGRLVFFTNLYGPGMDFSEETAFNSFLKTALRGDLLVQGEGLEKCYPTFIDDFIEGLIRAMVLQGTEGGVFYLINPEDLTVVNLAYLLQSKIFSGKPKIEFISGERGGRPALNKELLLETAEELGWQPKVGLEEGFKKIFEGRTEELKELMTKERKNGVREPRGRGWRGFKWRFSPFKVGMAVLLLIVFWLLWPIFSFGWHAGWGVRDLSRAGDFGKAAKFEAAEERARRSRNHFQGAKKSLGSLGILAALPFKNDDIYEIEQIMDIGINLSEASRHFILAAEPLYQVWRYVFSAEEGGVNLKEAFLETNRELRSGYEKLSFAEGFLENVELEKWLRIPGGEKLLAMKENLPQIRQKIAAVYSILPALDKVLGGEEKKVYLVLFQNNMELRPTGGFIGSYGLLTFEGGRMTDFKVEDVYTADGQLRGYVEPPKPIRVYLNEAAWYFRDCNWDPDFFQTSLNSAWFLEKEMGLKVNGVIGINLYVVEEILRSLGPVWLPDYEEEISVENLFLKAQSYVEKDFFPGSTQKRDFLGLLSRQVFEEVKTAGVEESGKIGEAILKSLEERQMMATLDEEEAMAALRKLGWDGGLREVACDWLEAGEQEGDCVADYTFFVEANLGVNKANYLVRREVREEVEIEEERVERSLEILYENKSSQEPGWGGGYKNYLRVIIPERAELLEITIDDLPVEEEKIEKERMGERNAYGFLVLVPRGEKKKVLFRYGLPLRNQGGKFVYLLLIQKQSGIGAEPMEVLINFPESWQVESMSPAGLTGRQAVVYNTDLAKDRLFKIEFKK